jgi:CspA family cold shock protein
MTATKGTVKWFNNAKGYGFILSEANQEDIFAHYSAIEMDGYKSLKAGQQVLFEVQFGEKGVHATHIRPLVPELSTAPTAIARTTLASTPTRIPFNHMQATGGEQEMQRQARGTG